jgi:hypothetical protein
LKVGLGLLFLAPLSACSSSKHKNPVASSEEVGKVEESDAKPGTYIARAGDTLRKIAGRPEIYADPDLWPLIQEANADLVGDGMMINPGTRLKIPRDLSAEQLEVAREKSRQYAAEVKMSPPERQRVREARVKQQVAAKEEVAAPSKAQPVPQAKKGRILFPVLLVLLLVLAALAVLLFYFMKKDRKEENPQ